MKSIVTLILLILMVGPTSARPLGQAGTDEKTDTKHARFPASRTVMPGEIWLSWPFPFRVWFAQAALAGYRAGYDEGCRDAKTHGKGTQAGDRQKPEDDVCPNGSRFRNEGIHYARQMTDFYTQHPEDRDVPLALLVAELIGPKPKTPDEIHQWLSNIDK
jgi:hypothetical protein